MASYMFQGDTIECARADMCAKKPNFCKGVFNLQLLGEENKTIRCVKYKMERDGMARIIKELNPKKPWINPKANLELGDYIDGHKYEVSVKGNRPLRFTKGNFSGRHNSQYCTTNNFTQAKISEPYQGIKNAVTKRLLEEKKEGQ